jgi:hypothetical protein
VRDKNYNTGVRGVLLDIHHFEKMGSALWLYSWLILRQTHQSGTIGWVLGGSPISYREIEEETGFNRRTLEGWFRKLRSGGYIQTSTTPSGVVVRITKAKKFAQAPRKFAEGVRQTAGTSPQDSVAFGPETPPIQQLSARIGSSSVERIKDRIHPTAFHKHFHTKIHNQTERRPQKPSGLEEENPQSSSTKIAPLRLAESSANSQQQHFTHNAREFLRLLRRELDTQSSGELKVDANSEVRRS